MPTDEEAELNELRRRRLREIESMQGPAPAAQFDAQQAEMDRREAERSEALRRILTPEARERLGRIRLAKPEVAQAVEQQVLALAATGRLPRAIDDATLRAILQRIMPERRETRITRR